MCDAITLLNGAIPTPNVIIIKLRLSLRCLVEIWDKYSQWTSQLYPVEIPKMKTVTNKLN